MNRPRWTDAPRAWPIERFRFSASGLSRQEFQHQDTQVFGLLQIVHDIVDAREALQIGLVIELGIDRHQIVDTVVLHGMAAVVEHRHVCIGSGARKPDGGLLHLRLADIGREDDVEIASLQRGGHILRVMCGVGQWRRMGISAVTDDQRHPLFCQCRSAPKPARDQREQAYSEKCAHEISAALQVHVAQYAGGCL